MFKHDDVIKWKHFPRYWPFVRGIHRSPVNSPHKGQWRGALMFSLISVWINGWVNNREAGDLRRHHGHYDVIVMERFQCLLIALSIWTSFHSSVCTLGSTNTFNKMLLIQFNDINNLLPIGLVTWFGLLEAKRKHRSMENTISLCNEQVSIYPRTERY